MKGTEKQRQRSLYFNLKTSLVVDTEQKGDHFKYLNDTETDTVKETQSTRPTQASYPNTVTVIEY